MKSEKLKFTSTDFYDLLEKQERKCALTGVELTPLNTELELIDCNRVDGKFDMKNFYLIDKDLKFLARQLSKVQIIELCKKVLECQGYKIVK